MLAKEVMSKEFAVCTEELLLTEVYKLMAETNAEFVTVVESRVHRKPIGIISEHGICMQIVGKGKNPRGMTAANVMDANVLKARENSDLQYCLKLIGDSRFGYLHIVDESGMMSGVLSRQTLEKNVSEPRLYELGRSAFMSEYRNAATNRNI